MSTDTLSNYEIQVFKTQMLKLFNHIPRRYMTTRPIIVCLCGSTKFYEEFQKANFRETMAGKIVLTVGFYPRAEFSKKAHGEDVGITAEEKIALDELHKRKIDLADEILVLNKNGYVGDSTKSEIDYAIRHSKSIRWLEPIIEEDLERIFGVKVRR